MSWTRSNNKENGTFSYEVFDWNGNLYEQAEGFTNYKECERAAEAAERKMTFEMQNGPLMPLEDIFAEMDDDALLSELFG